MGVLINLNDFVQWTLQTVNRSFLSLDFNLGHEEIKTKWTKLGHIVRTKYLYYRFIFLIARQTYYLRSTKIFSSYSGREEQIYTYLQTMVLYNYRKYRWNKLKVLKHLKRSGKRQGHLESRMGNITWHQRIGWLELW